MSGYIHYVVDAVTDPWDLSRAGWSCVNLDVDPEDPYSCAVPLPFC